MNEIAYTPYDVAVFLKWANFTRCDENLVKNDIWLYDNISFEYTKDKKKFIDAVNSKLMMLSESSYSDEVNSINVVLKDIGSNFVIENTIDEFKTIETFFKIIKLRLTYVDGTKEVKIKLRTILKVFGYKRRSKNLVDKIKNTIKELGLNTYLKGHKLCDIANISLDDMVMLRIDKNIM